MKYLIRNVILLLLFLHCSAIGRAQSHLDTSIEILGKNGMPGNIYVNIELLNIGDELIAIRNLGRIEATLYIKTFDINNNELYSRLVSITNNDYVYIKKGISFRDGFGIYIGLTPNKISELRFKTKRVEVNLELPIRIFADNVESQFIRKKFIFDSIPYEEDRFDPGDESR